jgi:hypothetical protein
MAICDGCQGGLPEADVKRCADPSCQITDKEKEQGYVPKDFCTACLDGHMEDAHKSSAVVKAEQKAHKLTEAAARAQAEADKAREEVELATRGVITGDATSDKKVKK